MAVPTSMAMNPTITAHRPKTLIVVGSVKARNETIPPARTTQPMPWTIREARDPGPRTEAMRPRMQATAATTAKILVWSTDPPGAVAKLVPVAAMMMTRTRSNTTNPEDNAE